MSCLWCLNGLAQGNILVPSQALHSSDVGQLGIVQSLAHGTFSFYVPKIWNSIPENIRNRTWIAFLNPDYTHRTVTCSSKSSTVFCCFPEMNSWPCHWTHIPCVWERGIKPWLKINKMKYTRKHWPREHAKMPQFKSFINSACLLNLITRGQSSLCSVALYYIELSERTQMPFTNLSNTDFAGKRQRYF